MAIAIFAMNAQAQNLSFGPTGGLGHSWTSFKGSAERRFHTSYNIGGKMVYSFMGNWGVSGDLKFSSEGQTLGTSSDNNVSTRANYIRIPLQGIHFFGQYGDRVRPKISIGPSFGFLVGGKLSDESNGIETGELKTMDYWKSFDLGVTGALGGNIRIAEATWLNIDMAYYHGLTNVAESGSEVKNRNLGFNIGVTFPVGTVRPEEFRQQ